MNFKEACNVLGVPENVSKEEAKKAFRKLAAKHHPDKSDGNEDLFKKINEAYQVIDTGKDFGPTQSSTPNYANRSGFSGGIDLEEILRQAQGGNPFSRQRKFIHATDRYLNESISFKESVIGCQKNLKFKRNIKCTSCDGNGVKKINNGCGVCGGSGMRTVQQGNVIMRSTCSSCGGMSKVEPCKECHENGYVETETNITVNIPGGVKEGRNVLRLEGIGDYAGNTFGMDQYASMLLNLNIEKDEFLSLEDDDVITDCEISLLEALEGCEKTIKTIDGEQNIKISPKIKNKEEIILPKLGVNREGNERVIILVNYPSDTNNLINFLKENI